MWDRAISRHSIIFYEDHDELSIVYRLLVNKADLIHLSARRKEQLIKTQMKGGW